MIKVIWRYIWGYLIVEIHGNALERVFNKMSSIGISLWDIRRIKHGFRFKMRARDYHRLRPLVRYRKCKVRMIRKKGLPFIQFRTGRRKALVVGILAFFIFLKTLSSFLWFIEITGNELVSTYELLSTVEEYGVHAGMLCKAVEERLTDLEQRILANHMEVAWVSVHVQGTRLYVEVVEKTLIDETDVTDVIAAKPGVVTQLITLKGKSMIKEGDTVIKGQVLIQAANRHDAYGEPDWEGNLPPYLPPVDGEVEPAKGIVKARVWYEGYGEAELTVTEERLTGLEERMIKLKVGNKLIHLSGPKKVNFKHYRVEREVKSLSIWRNLTLPIEIVIEDYQETTIYQENRSYENAKFMAKEQAVNAILNSLPSDAIIIQSPKSFLIDDGKKDNNIVRVKVCLEVEENIARSLLRSKGGNNH